VLVQQSLADPSVVAALHHAAAVDVLAVGKAAAPMLSAFVATSLAPPRNTLTIGVDDAGHPVPDRRSVAAARNALDMARAVRPHELLVVLLSGGASALMALPADDLTLEDKQQSVRVLLSSGADISELNTVRKHLSAIKGGQLAAACAGGVLTLAVSDVVGDDLSVIGSGPTVPDESTWSMALAILDRRAGRKSYPRNVVDRFERGVRGEISDTPKTGDPRLAQSRAVVIGSRLDALTGARRAASARGFAVHVVTDPIVGEARAAAREHLTRVNEVLEDISRPACVLSAGETTVNVQGSGTGGRNQEFALAIAEEIASLGSTAVVASVGTDGIDGPTDAAGAFVDTTTGRRAAAAGLVRDRYLENNDSHAFFLALDDLVRLGPTGTNVGDLQVVLVGE
jgi:hydroxypyruvate reductase